MIIQDSAALKLAIVIPGYRKRFLEEALQSIARQTDQRFHLYVFDDASPDDLKSVFASVVGESDRAKFFRFDQNAGRNSLAEHWNRCVRATNAEPWVWLFSDDDIMDADCVSRFYHALGEDGDAFSVCRFNTIRIDAEGEIIAVHPPHPPAEIGAMFAYHRMSRQRQSYAPEYIFRRRSFDKFGGFVIFPYALGSDDASWIVFADDRPIVTIPEALVYWRFSGQNVSDVPGSRSSEKYLALAEFSEWIAARFSGELIRPFGDHRELRADLSEMARNWFKQLLNELPADFSYSAALRLGKTLEARGWGNRWHWRARMAFAIFQARIRRRLKAR